MVGRPEIGRTTFLVSVDQPAGRQHTPRPLHTLGLPISECLALRWSDVHWLNKRLHVEHGIGERNVDDVKTNKSGKSLVVAHELLELVKTWRRSTEFSEDSDWIFVRPLKIGNCHTPTPAYAGAGPRKRSCRVGSHGHAHIPAFLPDVD